MNTKQKILFAALELASTNGLGNVSLSQIATKVGIQKATLYSHFSSKEEIISNLYEFLREKAKENMHVGVNDYGEMVKGKRATDILKSVVANYIKMNEEKDLHLFYKFVMSERVFNKEAAKIIVSETEKMILATKQLFYAMQIHEIMKFHDIDMAAVTFAMAVHSLLDYQEDKMLAENKKIGAMLDGFVECFCKTYGIEKEA